METAPIFRKALEQNREEFNRQFVLARHGRRRLDADAFSANLTTLLAPLAMSVEQAAGEEAAIRLVEELYPLLLDLTGRELLLPSGGNAGARRVWRKLLPAFPAILGEQPRLLAARLSNAALCVGSFPGAREDVWLARLLHAGRESRNLDELLVLGQVAAWRAGMVQYRESALALCRSLSAEMLRLVLDLPPGAGAMAREDILEGLADPWRIPGEEGAAKLGIVARVGGFRGLGGPFLRPPRVRRFGDDLLVDDGFERRVLHADRFGAALLRHSRVSDPLVAPRESGPPGLFGLAGNGRVSLGKEAIQFPELAQASSSASTSHTLAATLPVSHHVYVVARCVEQGR